MKLDIDALRGAFAGTCDAADGVIQLVTRMAHDSEIDAFLVLGIASAVPENRPLLVALLSLLGDDNMQRLAYICENSSPKTKHEQDCLDLYRALLARNAVNRIMELK